MASNLATSPRSSLAIRRRRCLLFSCVLLGLLFFFGVPWELPPRLKEAGFSVSRANIAQLVKASPPPEIYGLLHVVTGDADHKHMLNHIVDLDPTKPIDLAVYAAETELDWAKEAQRLNKEYPVIVFSKSYCPFSQRAKGLLKSYGLQPPPKVVEVDLRDDGTIIKSLLTRLTNHSTFPNVIIQGISIGGSDDLQTLHSNKTLVKMLEKAGVTVNSKGPG